MTTVRENEILTRVGAGTPMGELMRRYWIPAAISTELTADGDPVRLKLLGEELIAFRDTDGRVGIMDHRCPHRCASLFFGRNEEGGLRCVYHGWKFNADGDCVDMANVPPHQDFKHKVHAKAYKTAERNGLIWVYMGDQAKIPALPAIPATLRPTSDNKVWMAQRECNWLQGMEGEMDTSHLGFLHLGKAHSGSGFMHDSQRFAVAEKQPEYEYSDTEVGCMYGAYRPAPDGQTYWRIGHFASPFWAMMPLMPIERCVIARAYVPMDDTHTMILIVTGKPKGGTVDVFGEGEKIVGYSHNPVFVPNGSGFYDRWRLKANPANDFFIDRAIQRDQSFTGIDGVFSQDDMVTTSMGAISDRTFEHLGPSDLMITRIRRRLINAAVALERDGTPPPGSDNPEAFAEVRSGNYVVNDKGREWVDTYREQMLRARAQLDFRQAAE